jgi:glycosyltransferase involved in cell wall biosynthesis
VPVVASRVGGLPEIVKDGETGFVCHPDDLEGMAERGIALLTDAELHARIARTACRMARSDYCADRIVPVYEACYEQVLRGA